MRLPLPPRSSQPVLETGAEPLPELLAGWSATRWQYTSLSDPWNAVDMICDLGGSIAITLSDRQFILTCDIPGRGSLTVAGSFEIDGEILRFTALDSSSPQSVRVHQAGRTLSFHSEASAWDFDGTGKERAAWFSAVLVRL